LTSKSLRNGLTVLGRYNTVFAGNAIERTLWRIAGFLTLTEFPTCSFLSIPYFSFIKAADLWAKREKRRKWGSFVGTGNRT